MTALIGVCVVIRSNTVPLCPKYMFSWRNKKSTTGGMASIVDPNQMAYSVVSDLVLHFLLRHACPNSLGYYGTFFLTLVL